MGSTQTGSTSIAPTQSQVHGPERGAALIARFILCCALILLALLAILSGKPDAAGAQAPGTATLISTSRLLYDPAFPPYAVEAWLAKRGSPLATQQETPGDRSSTPGNILGMTAARQGINPKVLLTWLELRGELQQPTTIFGLPGDSDFTSQVDEAAKLLREGLLPGEVGKSFDASDGTVISSGRLPDAGSYALGRALAASADMRGWSSIAGSGTEGFVETYRRLFGEDPRIDAPLAAAASPFLYPPFYAPFEHRSYFDHTFPTVDEGSDGNPLMTSYDGVVGRLYDQHDGHDYDLPIGTPVYAAAPGTIYFLHSNDCGDPNTYGVLVRHTDGYETLYWHMSSLAGTPGTSRQVARGELIGNSGQSGCANRPHLHFELRHNGYASDPYGWSGPGNDPCPALVNGPAGYHGCETSNYVWAVAPDGPNGGGGTTPTRTPTPTPTSTPPSGPPPTCPGDSAYMSSDVGKRVPSEGTNGTTTSRLQITDGPTISSISVVGINVEHTWAADLDVFLISPAGTRVELFTDVCDTTRWAAGDTGFTLSDSAAAVIGSSCPPRGGSYRPEGLLASLIGQPSSGTWLLEVIDDAGFDSGTLQGWGLDINGSGCSGCAVSFSDVAQSDYFYEPVRYLLCRGVVSGYGDNTFRPYSQVTRAQLLKMVALTEGWDLSNPARPTFIDVGPGDWFYSYVETAVGLGVISGYSDGSFRPGNTVNRGQTAKIIVLSAGWFLASPAAPDFRDVPTDNPYYQYVETAALRRIMSGYSDGNFRPFDLAIRGQIAKMLYTRLNS